MTTDTIIKRILIIDDDADLRKLLLAYLGKMFDGVELVEYDPVANGIPGQDFNWSRFDVLILDYYLSIVGVTGLDILQANRKNPVFPAVIMLTGAGNEEIAVRALKAGVYDYLRKQSLDKQVLQSSIVNAYQKHQAEKKRLSELTQQGHAFNKAIFYQQLEYKKVEAEYRDRVFLLVALDHHTQIEEQAGIILRDNIVRHIAKQCYELFKQNKSNPGITRLGDHYIALLIDACDSQKSLESVVSGLTDYLAKKPYKFVNTEFPFSVSIGIVLLTGQGQSADLIIRNAKYACKIAGVEQNNSYYIYSDDNDEKAAATPVTTQVESKDIPAQTNIITPVSPALSAETPGNIQAPTAAIKPAGELTTGQASSKPTPDPSMVQQPGDTSQKTSQQTSNTIELELKQAFEDKRVILVFQPVISLLNEEIDSEDEMHRVFLQQINRDGSIRTGDEVRSQINSADFRKYVDRWILREIIGKITNSENNRYTFIVDISDASLADAGFFNWLRKLLTGLDSKNPGKFLAIEVNTSDLKKLEKQANALITFLRKSHEFKFVLGGIAIAGEMIESTKRIKFDLVRCGHKTLQELQVRSPAASDDSDISQLDTIRSNGTRFIADDIEDALILTEAISHGIEYAMGKFIGEPTNHLDDVTNIESFEII